MTLTKLFIYIAIAAVVILAAAMVAKKAKNPIINWFQFFVGGLFIFSGVIKAIDPVGTAIKMEEYFEVFIQYTPFLESFWHFFAKHALAVSIFMIVLEIYLGIALMMGKFVKSTLGLLLAIILFFTFLTGFSHFTQKVTDCGCFGDFMKLTPYQSFMKDIFLTVLIMILLIGRKHIATLAKDGIGTAVVIIGTIAATWFAYSNYFDMPIKDFRAYKIGVHIPTCMTLPPDAKPTITETLFTYKNNETGEEVILGMADLTTADFSKLTYVDRVDKVIQKGDEVKCKDFYITDIDGNEVTEDILTAEKLFVITSFDLNKSNIKGFERMKVLAEEAAAKGYTVVGITGSALDQADAFRHELGLAVPFYNLDAVPIKTINRSNPGLMLLEKGTILGKWHHRKVNSFDKVMKNVK
jgi:hypothetical protein